MLNKVKIWHVTAIMLQHGLCTMNMKEHNMANSENMG